MRSFLLATTNPDKAREIRAVLGTTRLTLVTLRDLAPIAEPEETGDTFWQNAREKAQAYARASGLPAVAEDSGLVIDALDGEPGVKSARFLGAGVSYPERFKEIYRRLVGQPSPWTARFVTALAVAAPDGALWFETEAVVNGEIAVHPAGQHGFGYDPIFFYPPLGRTTAQLTMDEKNAVSHRARAFRDFARWSRHYQDTRL